MARNSNKIQVYLEVGKSRTFAVALDWPGWCRSARNPDAALQALYDFGPRYARVLKGTRLGFRAPSDLSDIDVVERRNGSATTDFGAPDLVLARDKEAVDAAELKRWQVILIACWRALDASAASAKGKTLAKGPRGGGRELDKIVEHVLGVDEAYLRSLGGILVKGEKPLPNEALANVREEILTTLVAAARGETPKRGPRGGQRWPPRYFVRRLAWHELDHVWEIEDRSAGPK